MRFKLGILIIGMLFLLVSCNNGIAPKNNKNFEPNNIDYEFEGTWKITDCKVFNDISGLFSDESDRRNIEGVVGSEVQFAQNKIKIIDEVVGDVKYKLKVVDKNYVVSYEYNITAKELLNGKDNMDIISITDTNSILGEFYIIDTDKIMMVYRGLLLTLQKNSDEVKIGEEDSNKINGQQISNENKNDVGVMIGLRKPRLKNADGTYSREEYRTVWIGYKNDQLKIYERDNIIYPRLNGIAMIEAKYDENSDNEYFVATNLDGKTVGNVDLHDESNVRKSINFVSNDYVAFSKYVGKDFKNTYPQYEMSHVNNINQSQGFSIKDIFSEEAQVSYLKSFNGELAAIPYKERLSLNEEASYDNFTLDRSEGKWILKGKISPKNMQDDGEDFNLNIKPSRLVKFNSLSIPWKTLKSQMPLLKDAFTSPNGELAIIQLNDYLVVYKQNDGKLDSSPLFDIPLYNDEDVIMTEWCSGSYVDLWQKPFLSGIAITN